MIYFLLLDRKERYPSHEDQNLPPRNEIGRRAQSRRVLRQACSGHLGTGTYPKGRAEVVEVRRRSRLVEKVMFG